MASMAFKKYLIIGISGVTSGGKTTLCEYLSKYLGSRAETLNMDDYFYPDEHPNHIRLPEFNGHANWEALEAVDLERMHNDILTWVKRASLSNHSTSIPVLLIEGILVFNYKPLLDFYDRKYFFTLTKEQCWQRRLLRTYIPPDPPGYFNGVVWPMYLKNREELTGIKDIYYLDGNSDVQDICKVVSEDIDKLSTEYSTT